MSKYSCGSDDITFCADTCYRYTCFRHPNNQMNPMIVHSYGFLKGTSYCPYYKDKSLLNSEINKGET